LFHLSSAPTHLKYCPIYLLEMLLRAETQLKSLYSAAYIRALRSGHIAHTQRVTRAGPCNDCVHQQLLLLLRRRSSLVTSAAGRRRGKQMEMGGKKYRNSARAEAKTRLGLLFLLIYIYTVAASGRLRLFCCCLAAVVSHCPKKRHHQLTHTHTHAASIHPFTPLPLCSTSVSCRRIQRANARERGG